MVARPSALDRVATTSFVAASCDSIDFNGDGVFPDNQDIIDYLFVFAGGTCPTATCNDLDFNNDGVTPDVCDTLSFLEVFSGGVCTPCGA